MSPTWPKSAGAILTGYMVRKAPPPPEDLTATMTKQCWSNPQWGRGFSSGRAAGKAPPPPVDLATTVWHTQTMPAQSPVGERLPSRANRKAPSPPEDFAGAIQCNRTTPARSPAGEKVSLLAMQLDPRQRKRPRWASHGPPQQSGFQKLSY
uniref:Uncharacterized protein n=1 Tax=Sphaerodactylus townsendi TaxID=933632 RepID=A0ACB8GAP7_9SAUR